MAEIEHIDLSVSIGPGEQTSAVFSSGVSIADLKERFGIAQGAILNRDFFFSILFVTQNGSIRSNDYRTGLSSIRVYIRVQDPHDLSNDDIASRFEDWAVLFNIRTSSPVRFRRSDSTISISYRANISRPVAWQRVYTFDDPVPDWQRVYTFDDPVPDWQRVYTFDEEATTWQKVYTFDGEPFTTWQKVYTFDDAGGIETWNRVYTFPYDPAFPPQPLPHPRDGAYRFLYSPGHPGPNLTPSERRNIPVALVQASQLAPEAQRIPIADIIKIIQSDPSCDVIEHNQRFPADGFPSDNLTTGAVNINLPDANVTVLYGYAKGQIGKTYYAIFGHVVEAQRARRLGTQHMEIRYEIADAPPSWWVPDDPIGIPSVQAARGGSTGGIFAAVQLIEWVWTPAGDEHQPGLYSYYDCMGLFHAVQWEKVYTFLDAGVDTWQRVYSFPDDKFPVWERVYTLDGNLIESWQKVYTFDDTAESWQRVYTFKDDPFEEWQRVYTFIGDRFPEEGITITAPDGTRLIASGEWQRGAASLGRNNAAYLGQVLPLQMQLIFDNRDGNYDPGKVAVGHKIDWNIFGRRVASGFVTRIEPSTDHATGLETAIVHCQGALAQTNLDDYELSLFVTESVRTGEVINDVLDQAGWPAADRRISRGQVRLDPAHYIGVLSSRQLHRAGPSLRAMERAEIGLLHEGMGDIIAFEERFAEELDTRAPVMRFGNLEGSIPPTGTVRAQETWDNVYTVVQVGAERALVQAEREIWSLQDPVQIPAGISWVLDISELAPNSGLANENVRSVVQWSPLRAEDVAGIQVTIGDFTRTSVRITAVTGGTLTKLVLRGRGVALYGDLGISERNDPDAVKAYGRRVLRLPKSFIGDGLNHGGDGVAEGEAHADLLLYAHSQPPVNGALPVSLNHHPEVLDKIAMRIPVSVDSSTGLPAGIYRVQGWDVQGDADTGLAEILIKLSRQVPREVIRDSNLSFTPAGTDWQNVSSQTILGMNPHVLAAYALIPPAIVPKDDELEVECLRLVVDGKVAKSWTIQDVVRDVVPHPLAALVNEDIGAGGMFQARRVGGVRIQVRRLVVVSLATPVRPR